MKKYEENTVRTADTSVRKVTLFKKRKIHILTSFQPISKQVSSISGSSYSESKEEPFFSWIPSANKEEPIKVE